MGYLNCAASGSGISGGNLQNAGTVTFTFSTSLSRAEITPYLIAIDKNGNELGQASPPSAAGGNWKYSDSIEVTPSSGKSVSVNMATFKSAFASLSNLGGLRLNTFINSSSQGYLAAENFDFYFAPHTLCYWGNNARCWLSSEWATSEAVLYWSGAVAGTDNPIAGYYVYYAVVSGPDDYPGEDEWIELGNTTGTSMRVPAPSGQGVYHLFSVWVYGKNQYDFDESWIDCEALLRKGHEALEGFTDPILTKLSLPVKALHMTELQDRTNTLRTFYGLKTYTFSTITAGETSVGGWSDHVAEIRTALDEVAKAAGKTHEAWIAISVNCPRVDVIEQLRAVVLAL